MDNILLTFNIDDLEKDCGWCLNTDIEKQISKDEGNLVWCKHYKKHVKDIKECNFYK